MSETELQLALAMARLEEAAARLCFAMLRIRLELAGAPLDQADYVPHVWTEPGR